MQASLSVLLEEKWKLETRVRKLEEQLEEAHKAVRRGEADATAAAAAAAAVNTVIDRADASIESATPPLTPRPSAAAPPDHGNTTHFCLTDAGRAVSTNLAQRSFLFVGRKRAVIGGPAPSVLYPMVGRKITPPAASFVVFAGSAAVAETARATAAAAVSAAAATVAAAARAAKAETALSEALEAVEELEARCAAAQARESEVVREADARINELVKELEEANDLGAQVLSARYACEVYLHVFETAAQDLALDFNRRWYFSVDSF